MKNFDLFVAVDWSGAKVPVKTKSIAVATLEKQDANLVFHSQIRSRSAVAEFIESLCKSNQRALIGIDCNFGYAESIVKAQCGKQASAHDLWQVVDATNQDNANYFAGDFWVHKEYAQYFWTSGKMPHGFSMPKRRTEVICAKQNYGHPESPFKLIGAKQVGKGGLAGMRMVHYLKQKYGDLVSVWPFDRTDTAKIVITEIYPRQFLMRSGYGIQKIRDISALNKALSYFGVKPFKEYDLTDHDTDALVSAAGLRYLCGLNNTIPSSISDPCAMTNEAKQCEGWIFGVGDTL